MTRPIFEDGYSKEIGRANYRTSQLERRPENPGGGGAVYQIKVKRDDVPLVVGDDAFIWFVPEAFDQFEVMKVEGAYGTAGAGSDTQIQLRLSDPCELGGDILTDKLVIPDGECNDDGTATVAADTILTAGQHLHVDVDQSSGGLGFNIALTLLSDALASAVVQGAQGPPGGVTAWQGQWQGSAATAWADSVGYTVGDIVENGGTFYRATVTHVSGALTEPGVGANWMTVWEEVTYQEGEAVQNGGTSYVATVDHTATVDSEPGVGADWEDFWMVLVQGHEPYSGIVTMILGNELPLDFGIKAAIPIPFDCEIIEATLLADQAGDCVVDLWLDSYGAYPPTDADSITAAAPLTLVGQNKTTDVVLSGWTTTLTAGQVLMVVIESVANLYWLSVGLRVQRP